MRPAQAYPFQREDSPAEARWAESDVPGAGNGISEHHATVRLLVVLIVLLSAIAAFSVGGLIAVSGSRATAGAGAGGHAGPQAAAAAIGRLGAGDVAGAAPASVPAADASPTPVPGAVKQQGVAPVGDTASPSPAAPLRTCSAPPTKTTDGSGLPIPVFPLC